MSCARRHKPTKTDTAHESFQFLDEWGLEVMVGQSWSWLIVPCLWPPDDVRMSVVSTSSHADLLREYLELLSQPGAESRLPAWKDWFRLRVGGAVAVGAALALTGCDESDDGSGNAGGAAGASQTQPNAGGTTGSVAAGGTSNSATSTTGGISGVALYAAPMTSGGAGNIGGTKYGVPMPSGGSGNPGSMVALYAVVMNGGSANPSSVATGGNSNTSFSGGGFPIYAAPMTGGSGSVVTSPASSGGSMNLSARYGVPMGN